MSQSSNSDYKAGQRRQWGSVADGWYRWWPTFEQSARPVSDRMIELSGIGPGSHVLDIACGIGEPAITAAKLVGSEGRVTATDLADEMLALAQQRAAELDLDNITFRQADAEAIPYPDESFDAALCRWGLMLMPDKSAALGEMRRVLRPGGRLVAVVWGTPQQVPLLSLPMGVAGELMEVPVPPPGAPGPFSMADPALLERALSEAGFSGVTTERQAVTFEFATGEAYTRFIRDVAAPVRELLADKPPAEQERFWKALEEAAGRFAEAGGAVHIGGETFCAAGHKP